MSVSFRQVLAAAFLLFALPLSAQRSGRTQDPTLNKGEGLEMSRKDLDKMRNQNQAKNSRQVDAYMFATSYSLLDSVIFVSDIHLVKDVTVNNKWFVKERLVYEKQFTDYVIAAGGDESYMSSLLFAEKQKKLIKKREHLIKRNKKKLGFQLVQVSDFQFSKPESEENPD
jgi:hypothetical protein